MESSESDDDDLKPVQNKSSDDISFSDQIQTVVHPPTHSSQRFSNSLPDEPAMFSLSLNVEPCDADESLMIEGDTVHFFTGNPSIQKFKGHVSVSAEMHCHS